ncbi:MAG: glycosyltransferase family 4 protein [Actinomycetota bacterium]
MKIFFDARFIRHDQHDGISRFSAELFRALAKITPVIAIINDKRQLAQLPAGTEFVELNDPTHFLAELRLPYRLNQLGAEVVFSPMQTMGSIGRKYKLILTLHDLIYYSHRTPPRQLPLHIRIAWRIFHLSYLPQRLMLNRADLVATVSETTKALIRSKHLTRRPVEVVYNAAGALSEDYLHKPPVSRPRSNTLLYMGSFMDYKNVESLIRGMKHLPGYRLLLLSRIDPARKLELQKLVHPTGGKVEFLNGVSEGKYHQLLDQALALVSASKDEGFGIPLVEAMARGVPVVVSDIPIFKEVGERAAIYFDPNQPRDFSKAIRSLDFETKWLERSELSLRQAAKFSWKKSAQVLLDLIIRLRG